MLLFILITVVTMGISLSAAARVKSNFAKYSKVPNARGLSGAQAADFMLRRAGVSGYLLPLLMGNRE